MKYVINAEKFVDVIQACGLMVPEEVLVEVVDDMIPGAVIASAANHQFVIKHESWDTFTDLIEKENHTQLSHYLESRFEGIKYVPQFYHESDQGVIGFAADMENKLSKEISEIISARVSGLIAGSTYHIKRLASMINKCISEIANDGNIVKDKDAMLTFDIKEGTEHELCFCLDFIDPVNESENSEIMIMRTPMTEEQKIIYFGELQEPIEASLNEVSDYLSAFFCSKLVNDSAEAKEFATSLVMGTVMTQFMNLRPMLVSFGGRDNWRLFGDLTPNSEACHEILDKEIEYLVNYLKGEVPLDGDTVLTEMPDIYSVDMANFEIYPRDQYNQPIGPAMRKASEHFHMRYSEGFMELMKVRIRQSDSRHFFFA